MALTKVSSSMKTAPTSAEVQAHVTDTDLTPVRNDIATLALHSAIADNKAAYNLSNAFIDQFEDDTGLDVQTDCDRDATEFMGSIAEGVQSSVLTTNNTGYLKVTDQTLMSDENTNMTFEGWVYCSNATQTYQMMIGQTTDFYGAALAIAGSIASKPRQWHGNGTAWQWDNMDLTWTQIGYTINTWMHWAMVKQATAWKIYFGGTERASTSSITVTDDSNNTQLFGTNQGLSGRLDGHMTGIRISDVARYTSNFTPSTTAFTSDSNTLLLINSNTTNGSTTFTDSSSNGFTVSTGGSGMEHSTDVTSPLSGPIVNATGNFTSATQTANASVSEMGIVVLYKNNEGTASLNTDLVAQVSADGGSNYANATLVAGGTFSSGINIAAVSGVSVTAGTAPKYKISFANQSSGSKETQVHGVALLY